MKNLKTFKLVWLGVTAIVLFFGAAHGASAATNISSVSNQHWAWSDVVGWIDFYNQGASNVTVSATGLTGSNVSSSVGIVSLNCGTATWGCGISYGVTNDGNGNLGGYAWNDTAGWISFYWGNAAASSTQVHTALCTSYGQYCGVYIDQHGNFQGYAWSDTIGWISFNCVQPGVCGTSNYEVAAGWAPVAETGMLDSPTLDTGVSSGTELNSIIWHGSLNGLPVGDVAFQLAASNSTSTSWTFTGPDGTASTTYFGNPNTPIPITNYPAYAGYRYFRYRTLLTTDIHQSISPQVTGVSVDWSP